MSLHGNFTSCVGKQRLPTRLNFHVSPYRIKYTLEISVSYSLEPYASAEYKKSKSCGNMVVQYVTVTFTKLPKIIKYHHVHLLIRLIFWKSVNFSRTNDTQIFFELFRETMPSHNISKILNVDFDNVI